MAVAVNGVEIPEQNIQAEAERLRPDYVAYIRANGGEPSDAQLREWAEEGLIEAELLRAEAVATQPVPSEERVRKELEENAESYLEVPEEQRGVVAREALQQRRLLKEIRKAAKAPGEAEMRAFFEANPQLFVVPEAVRLSHICRYVNPSTRADEFLNLLRIKSDLEQQKISWVEALEAYSDSFERDTGLFATVRRGELSPDIEKQLFALEYGTFSDVIDIGEGTLHLFRLLVRVEPEKVSFKDAKETVMRAMYDASVDEAVHAKLDALRAAAVIQRLA